MAGYAFARVRFSGANALFLVLLTGLLIPREVVIIPLFQMMQAMGWVDTHIPLILFPTFGNPVYTLFDGECSYAMKYYTSAFDPTLTNETAIAGLAGRFERLPDGYTFSIQTFDQDQYILDLDGEQEVMTDEFGNSHDLLSCNDNGR